MKNLIICMLAFLTAGALTSCSEENTPTTGQEQQNDRGEVSFEIFNENGAGTGTSTSPAEVSNGDTLNMVIRQKSSYTDSDGSVFECEPQATIRLFTKLDTVYVENLKQLTSVQEEPEIQTSAEGKNPAVNKINQKFQIGEQYVNFDLAYEVYNHVTTDGETVEMPYIKLNQANVGNSGVSEQTGSRTVVKSITVKPLPQTRASVSDTTWYEVNATFNLDIESINTKVENKQNLTFSVTYLGAVTTEIELSEPIKELSNTIDILGGTSSASSPFLVNPKETLSLLIKQNSSYTDAYGNKISCEPEAKINLFAQHDTVYVNAKEDLEGVPASQDFVFTAKGENPVLYSAVQLFNLGSQMIQLDMSYEIFTAKDIENNEIEMPYLKQNATMPGAASIYEISTAEGSKADTTFYEVKVPITLETIEVGTTNENIQNIEFVVSYIGAVVTLKEVPELVKVEYRTGYVWEEAHDNLPLLYYAKVYRDRYYSNGEVFTDEFVDNGHPAELNSYTGINTEFPCEEISRSEQRNDSIWTSDCVVAVEDMSSFEAQVELGKTDPGTWSQYVTGKLYENVNLSDETYTCSQNYETTSLQSGWYFQGFSHCQYMYGLFNGTPMITLYSDSRMYDQFLSIDGRIINFLEYKPQRTFSHKVEDVAQYKNGKRLTNECTTTYLGRRFYTRTVLTLYEK